MVEHPAGTFLVVGGERRSKFGVAVILSATVPQDDAMAQFLNSLEAVLRGAPVTLESFSTLTREMHAHLLEGVHLADKHRVINPARSLQITLSVAPALGLQLWEGIPSFRDSSSLCRDEGSVTAVIQNWLDERPPSRDVGPEDAELAARLLQVTTLLGKADLGGLIRSRFPHLGGDARSDASAGDEGGGVGSTAGFRVRAIGGEQYPSGLFSLLFFGLLLRETRR